MYIYTLKVGLYKLILPSIILAMKKNQVTDSLLGKSE